MTQPQIILRRRTSHTYGPAGRLGMLSRHDPGNVDAIAEARQDLAEGSIRDAIERACEERGIRLRPEQAASLATLLLSNSESGVTG